MLSPTEFDMDELRNLTWLIIHKEKIYFFEKVSLDEIVANAALVYAKAAKYYDETKDVSFTSYLYAAIKYELFRLSTQIKKQQRKEVEYRGQEISFEECNMDEIYDLQEKVSKIKKSRERQIYISYIEKGAATTVEELGISKQRIYQVIHKLRKYNDLPIKAKDLID